MPPRRTYAAPGVRTVANPLSKGRINQGAGQRFEITLAFMAKMEDLLCVQNGLTAKRTADRVIVTRSNLDFFLCGDAARNELALVDAKSFKGPRFGRSQIEEHQLKRAAHYAARNLWAGLVVLFRDSDKVVFFDVHRLLAKDGRAGFGAEDGVLLGTRRRFFLRRIWDRAGL